MANSIINLVKNGRFDLPNGHSVIMHEECRILATISIGNATTDRHQQQQQQIPLQIREYPYVVHMPDLSCDDYNAIISSSAPKLNSIRNNLIDTFVAVSNLIQHQKAFSDRSLNSKDLFRATKRLCSLSDLTEHRAVFMELFDVWAMHLTNQKLRRNVARTIGTALSLSEEEQDFIMDVYQPKIDRHGMSVAYGRTQLRINDSAKELGFLIRTHLKRHFF